MTPSKLTPLRLYSRFIFWNRKLCIYGSMLAFTLTLLLVALYPVYVYAQGDTQQMGMTFPDLIFHWLQWWESASYIIQILTLATIILMMLAIYSVARAWVSGPADLVGRLDRIEVMIDKIFEAGVKREERLDEISAKQSKIEGFCMATHGADLVMSATGQRITVDAASTNR